MSNQNTNGLAIFIDMRNSTEIDHKKKVYTDFYNAFRNINDNIIENLKMSSINLNYKAFIGDAVFLHYKTNSKQIELLDLLKKIQEIVIRIENLHEIQIGIGIGWGTYENVEIGINGQNLMAPAGMAIDLASKSSAIANKVIDMYFAMRLKKKNGDPINEELKDLIDENKEKYQISIKTTSSRKNYRFSFDK